MKGRKGKERKREYVPAAPAPPAALHSLTMISKVGLILASLLHPSSIIAHS
jgi:hypothetical protein